MTIDHLTVLGHGVWIGAGAETRKRGTRYWFVVSGGMRESVPLPRTHSPQVSVVPPTLPFPHPQSFPFFHYPSYSFLKQKPSSQIITNNPYAVLVFSGCVGCVPILTNTRSTDVLIVLTSDHPPRTTPLRPRARSAARQPKTLRSTRMKICSSPSPASASPEAPTPHASLLSATTSNTAALGSFTGLRCVGSRSDSRTKACRSGTRRACAKQLQAKSVLLRSPPPVFWMSYNLLFSRLFPRPLDAYTLYTDDLYGCGSLPIWKRAGRNFHMRTHAYHVGASGLRELLDYCPKDQTAHRGISRRARARVA